MNKSSRLGMAVHQLAGFHSQLMQIPRTEAVLWPGCALMMLEGEIPEKTLQILRRAEPEIQMACGCCGQPSRFLFPEKAEKRRNKLVSLLKKQGVRRIYTACPNCAVQLGGLEEFEILPIWQTLARHIRPEDLTKPEGRFVWHDPCPTRCDPAQQTAVRQLLALTGCDICQPEHTGCHTRCCGNLQMLSATDPAKSAALRKARLEEFPRDRTVLSSCEGCLDAFRSEGRDTRHLLELLFGQSPSRGWANRLKTTWKRKLP